MIIDYKLDKWATRVKNHICQYHVQHPSEVSYAGCTCSFSMLDTPKSPTEVELL